MHSSHRFQRVSRKLLLWLLTPLIALSLTSPTFAAERLDRIMETQTLRVGTPGDYRPFSIKTADGYEGLDVDIIKRMAEELGVKIEFIDTSWPNLMKDLADNKFDVAIGGITRTRNRVLVTELLPAYAPFGKVALIRVEDKDKLATPESLNQANVRVIKNPGGTNEIYVNTYLTQAQVTTHSVNYEIPALIAEGKGDVMITETDEAILYSRNDPRLYAAFLDEPLTPRNYMGFMLPKDDADYTRTMHFLWNLIDLRGDLKEMTQHWLHRDPL